MKIAAALLRPSFVWEEFLRQEGFPFRVMERGEEWSAEQQSLLIVTRPLAADEQSTVRQCLKGGGAVLGCARDLREIAGVAAGPGRIDYLLGEGSGLFGSVGLVDLGLEGEIPREARLLRTEQNTFAVFAGELLGGMAVILPFDPESALGDARPAMKNFYSRIERLPAERVSLVAKGEVRHLLRQSMEFLHLSRGLPYVHLWYFPGAARNLFAFRVDTDFAEKRDIDALYALARSHDMGLSWFIDVESHRPLLAHFRSMAGQEFGVHCYAHAVDPLEEPNRRNFSKAKQILREAGFDGRGLAAPYGIWNPALARVTVELGFAYSSEFSWAYDTLPGLPATTECVYDVLQVPIHPICVGSLRKAGHSESQMREYFNLMLDWKSARSEPLIFYHHPSDRHWGVLDELFRQADERGVLKTTLGEYAAWWNRRTGTSVDVVLRGEVLDLEYDAERGGGELSLRVIRAPGKESLVGLSPRIELRAPEWKERLAFLPPSDLRRTREFDTRTLLAEIHARMTRRAR